ncbi:MAG: hypothetical protein IT373_11625 [Polyangiaceae bacterium]|nr:hypothetical protein [Polyangiaceae bacterium]
MGEATYWLGRAMAVTHALLRGDSTREDLAAAVAERGRCIAAAVAAAKRAGALDATERALVAELGAEDTSLLRAVWLPCADAFRWLRHRHGSTAERFPNLNRLADED